MSRLFVRFHNVSFAFPSAVQPLFTGVSLHLPCGWSGVVGANGTGKTTLLRLAAGEWAPVGGVIEAPPRAVYLPQRTDHPPVRFQELVSDRAQPAWNIREMLGVAADWPGRWETLSHGERKRAQIAVALWLEPDLLAVDEPTNHLDAAAKEFVAAAIRSFKKVGLLVSHDRDLLDAVCGQCLFIDPPAVTVRPGGVSKGAEAAEIERLSARRQQEILKREFEDLRREAIRREQLAASADRRRSKRNLALRDHDGREKLNRVRVSGKDAVGGRLRAQLDGKLAQAEKKSASIRVQKEYETGIWLPGSISRRHALLELPAGSIAMGEYKQLHHPDLIIRPTDRIALTGINGSGKSTLVRRIMAALETPTEQRTYVPQEIDAGRSRDLLEQVRRLPADQLGHLMTLVSRLGSRPHRLLDSAEPSPGETRKLLLAWGMLQAPQIIVMDEPTNHMDLPSIEALEAALADCPCSLLLVSHDQRFLGKLTSTRWEIKETAASSGKFVLEAT